MICEKCGGNLTVSKTCSLCGHDNSAADFTPVDTKKFNRSSVYRSTKLTVLVWATIITDAITMLVLLFSGLDLIICILLAAIVIIEIVVCIFVLRLSKRAFIIYLIFAAIGAVFQIVSSGIYPVILKVILFYFIIKDDWAYME